MDLRILGAVEAHADGRAVPLGAAKRKALLAMLALADGPVPVERLIDGLWGDDPPQSATKLVHTYVSQLRKVLAERDGGAQVLTRGRGYELDLGGGTVDARRFEALVAEAARGRGAAAREALALWRGRPLADLGEEPFAVVEARRLEELRLQAAELAVDADLAEGRHRDVVAELEALIAEEPLREGLHARLVLALYRCGRQAEALEAYRRARTTLVEEVGVEPGPELRRLHERVLDQDPSLAPPPPPGLPPELVADGPLVGREDDLAWLRAHWERAQEAAGVVVALVGEAGSGRRRLAAALAEEVHAAGARVVLGTAAGTVRAPALVVADGVPDTPPPPGVLVVVRAGTPPPGVHGRALGPLSAGAVRLLVEAEAPAGAAADAPVARIARTSGGLPGAVLELARAWAHEERARRVEVVAARAAAGRGALRSVEAELAEGVAGLRVARSSATAARAVVCPYKGLATFDVADAPFFSGRERLVGELVARLVGAPLLGVVGPSGSGKSSAVRAGLLAALREGVLPGSEGWPQVVLRPGAHPPASFDLGEGRAVLAVDQFEEVFTLCRDPRERQAFLSAVVDVARGGAALVVLAIRADLYGRCAEDPELARMLAEDHVLVGPMRRDELRRAIEEPARRAGLRVEPGLADRLLEDVEGETGALPLLQSALLELWQRREGRDLTLAGYERTGGVRGAVARMAEDAYARLDPPGRTAARRVLLRLATAGDDGALVRRRVPLAELGLPDDAAAARAVDELADRRLVTVDEDAAEVAHEALLREWPRLRTWLEEDVEGRRLHARLAAAAREWDASGRDPADLWRGARLSAVADWAQTHAEDLNAAEGAFVAASTAAGETEALHQRRVNRRLRALLGVAAVLLVAAAGAGAVALDQRSAARAEASAAEAQRLGAEALVEDDLDRSLLLARQGVALQDSITTRGNLLAALVRSPAAIGVLRGDGDRLLATAVSRDGRRLAFADNDGSLSVVDPATRRLLARHAAPATVFALAYSRDGTRLAVAGADFVELLDARSLRRIGRPRVPPAAWQALAFAPDERELLVAGGSPFEPRTHLLRLDPRTGRPRGAPRTVPGDARSLAYSRAGDGILLGGVAGVVERDRRSLRVLRRLPPASAGATSPDGAVGALGSEDGAVRFVDMRTGRRRLAEGRHEGPVQSMAFTPDGRFLLTGGDDAKVIVWDVRRSAIGEVLAGHAGRVTSVAVAPDGATAWSVGLDARAIAWDLRGDRRLGQPFRVGGAFRQDGPASTAMRADGAAIVTARQDEGARVVDTRTLEQRALPAPDGVPVFGVTWVGRAGRAVAASGWDGALAVLDARTGRVLRRMRGHRGAVFTPSASADGRLLASTGEDGTLRIWDVRTGRPVRGPIRAGPSGDVGLSPDGRWASVGLGGHIDVFDVRRGRRRARLVVDEGHGNFARFSPDGRLLLAGTTDGRARLFRTRDWRPLGPPFLAHAGFVSSMSTTADGRLLVTSGTDGAARLWDVRSGKPIGAPLAGQPNVEAVAVLAPDGRSAYVVQGSGRAYAWDVRPSAWARHACAVAGRALTREEWRDALPGRPYAPACAGDVR